LRLSSFGGYGLALAALALVVFRAIECPPLFVEGESKRFAKNTRVGNRHTRELRVAYAMIVRRSTHNAYNQRITKESADNELSI